MSWSSIGRVLSGGGVEVGVSSWLAIQAWLQDVAWLTDAGMKRLL